MDSGQANKPILKSEEEAPPQLIELPMFGALKVVVPNSIIDLSTFVLLEQQDWFEEEIHFVRKWLQPGFTAVDIGANRGFYTLAMAQSVGPNGTIHSFEPSAQTFASLQTSVERNGLNNVKLHQLAISNCDGTSRFSVKSNSELNQIMESPGQDEETEQVLVSQLDTLFADLPTNSVQFIKIDAEGHEQECFWGGKLFFESQNPLVMFEVKSGKDVDQQLIEVIQQHHFDLFQLVPGLNLLRPYNSERLDRFQLNLFAVRSNAVNSDAFRDTLVRDFAVESGQYEVGPNYHYRLHGDFEYSRELQTMWQDTAPLPGGDLYLRGLSDFAQVKLNHRLSPSERCAILDRSLERITDALNEHVSAARLSSQARILGELGRRSDCLKALRDLHEIQLTMQQLCEPFLCACETFEQISPNKEIGNWFTCSYLSEWSEKQSYFSLQDYREVLPILERIIELGFPSVAVNRRFELLNKIKKLQTPRN